jgi:hypothetical protein
MADRKQADMSEGNPDKAAARKRKYYLKNREKVLERSRQQRLEDQDKARAYRRAWYLRNREKVLAQRHAYHARNRTAVLEYQRASRAANPDRSRANSRRARHGLSPDGWAAMWREQQGLCYLCGEELAESDAAIDHDHSCCPPKTSCPVCRRGLAHSYCNQSIGLAGDDPGRLRRLADALEAAKAGVASRMAKRAEQVTLF